MYLDQLLVFKLCHNGFRDDSKAWDLIKRAQNLKVLSLDTCYGITTIPNFSKCLGLEKLTLTRCDMLERIENFIGDLQSLIELEIKACMVLTYLPEEVGALGKLKRFSLVDCSGLRGLPCSIGKLTSLIELDISGTSIARLPNSIKGLVKLESFLLIDTRIEELPNSIGELKSLRMLCLSKYGPSSSKHHIWQLPSGISMLENLEELDLSGRDEIEGEIPDEIGELSTLRTLNLEHTHICGIPRTINMLHHLQILNLRDCHGIQGLPELPTSLTCLLLQSKSLLLAPNLSNLTNLVELLLSDGSRITNESHLTTGCNLRWIGNLFRLKKLDINLLSVLAPPELASLSHLEELTLSHLDLEALMQFPSSLLRLKLQSFSIRWPELLLSCLQLRNLSTLQFYDGEVEDIPLDGLSQLENLTVDGCKLLRQLSIPLELRKLRQVHVSSCPELVEIRVVGLSKSLESFFIRGCDFLIRICGLSYLKNLETLDILWCSLLTTVEGLNELESLKSLEVRQCPSLRSLIDASCTDIPSGCLVQIRGCGDFIKNSSPGYPSQVSCKHYKEKILLDKKIYEVDQETEDVPANREVGGATRVASSSVWGTASSSENGAALGSGTGRGSSSQKGIDFRTRFTKFKTPACFRKF